MLKITIWDVQHGSAALLQTPNGKNIVIDLGTGDYSNNNEAFSPIKFYLSQNIKKIDSLIITHPHTDHIDDIFNIDSINVSCLVAPKTISEADIRKANKSNDKDKIDKYLGFIGKYSLAVGKDCDPLLPENNGGVTIQYWKPIESSSNINNYSIVTVIKYLDLKIVIPGDNESSSWDELLKRPDFTAAIKNASILVASHHGRESGYKNELFNYFSPYLIIISDGRATETSVTEKYSSKAQGWTVHSNGKSEKRYCLTTRKDGTVEIQIYQNGDNKMMGVYTE